MDKELETKQFWTYDISVDGDRFQVYSVLCHRFVGSTGTDWICGDGWIGIEQQDIFETKQEAATALREFIEHRIATLTDTLHRVESLRRNLDKMDG